MYSPCDLHKEHGVHVTAAWIAQSTSGKRPVGLWGHSLTMINRGRALLFGGWSGGAKWHNDTYLLDLESWVSNTEVGY